MAVGADSRRGALHTWSALLTLALLPVAFLWPSLFGAGVFLPYDPARFPPAATLLSAEERAALEAQRANFDVLELPIVVVPELQLSQQQLGLGAMPAWNPYARFGGPLFASGLTGLAYPPTWQLLARDDPREGLALHAWFGFVVAGWLCFWLLRALRCDPWAALLGACTFAFGGIVVGNAHFYMRMHALIWLPGQLLAALGIARATHGARLGPTVGLAVSAALTWLAGFPPYAIAVSGCVVAWCAALVARQLWRDGIAGAARLVGWYGVAAALALALAAVQLLPMRAYYAASSRDLDPPARAIVERSFDPLGWLGLLSPTLFGDPSGAPPQYERSPLALALNTRTYWDDVDAARRAGALLFPTNFNCTEYAVFVGALPLLLALVGLLAARRPAVFVLAAIGACAALLATAPPALRQLYDLPGLETPMRWLAPLGVIFAAAAAAGLHAARHANVASALRVAGSVGLAIALACTVAALWLPQVDLLGHLCRRYAAYLPSDDPRAAALQWLGADNLAAGVRRACDACAGAAVRFALAGLLLLAWARFGRRTWVASRICSALALVAVLADLLPLARELAVSRALAPLDRAEAYEFLRRQRDASRHDGGFAVARVAPAAKEPFDLPTGLLFPERIRDLNAYTFVDAYSHRPFVALYGLEQMVRGTWPLTFPDDARLQLPWFDLIGLRYVFATADLHQVDAAVVHRERGPGGEFVILERPHPLPRAFVVSGARVLADDEQVVRALVGADLQPREEVLFAAATAVGPAPGARAGAAPRPTPARPVRFVCDDPAHVALQVDAGEPGYLVLADAWVPGWVATVDGEPRPIARGNLFMRVVPLDGAAHRVEFHFTSPGLVAGAIATGLGLLVVTLGLLWGWRGAGRSPVRPAGPVGLGPQGLPSDDPADETAADDAARP